MKRLHQMRINSLGVLTWDRLTLWESILYRARRLLCLPTRCGIVSRAALNPKAPS